MKTILIIGRENILNITGGMGVHIYQNALNLSKFEQLDIIVIGVAEIGGFYIIGNKEIEVEYKDWIHTPNSFRLFNILNENDFNNYGDPFTEEIMNLNILILNYVEYLKDIKIDLIHSHDSAFWLGVKIISIWNKCPVITTVHLSMWLSHPHYPKNPLWRFITQRERNCYNKSDFLIPVSEYYKQELKNEFFIEDDYMKVIGNAVDYEKLSQIKYKQSVRNKFPLNKKIVVFVGRMVVTKGINLILDAIKECQDLFFILISKSLPTMEDIRPIVERATEYEEKYDNFRWYRNASHEEKWNIMKIADIGIVPSLHEPFGIVPLEFFSMGVPTIITEIGGLVDFCNENNTIFTKPNSESLIEKLKKHKKNDYMIKNAMETAENMSWDKIAFRTLKIYNEVLLNNG